MNIIYIGRCAYNILWYSGSTTDGRTQTDRQVHLSRVCLNNNNSISSVIRFLFFFWTTQMCAYIVFQYDRENIYS